MVSLSFSKKVRFYLFRIRKASLPEIAYRLREWFFLTCLEKRPHLCLSGVPSCRFGETARSYSFPEIRGGVPTAAVNRLKDNKVATLNHDEESIRRFERNWRHHFFHAIKLSAADPDIRAVWEPARLQHLMLLMQHLEVEGGPGSSGRAEIERLVKERLLAWLDDNPIPCGPHFWSVMECGLRIPVFVRAVRVLDSLREHERDDICRAILQHGWLIRKRLSLYSSLGNHTVAEAVGLVMAGGLFRQDATAGEWLSTGIRLLEQECERQILSDGGPVEQSFAYHRFVLDLYWLAIDFLEGNGLHDCGRMAERVGLGEAFLERIQQDAESLPMIGDSDDGHAVALGLHPLRRTARGGGRACETFVVFPSSGYSLFRDVGSGLRMLFDHGRLGMEPLNNHGHADALSVFLSVGDKDFLIDPGTYRYNGVPEWRKYFKGTSAHNTVCIDGRDQARQLTGFIWDRSYEVAWRHERAGGAGHLVEASHDGYRKQRIPVTHTRVLAAGEPGSGEVVIEDRFAGTGRHEYALHYHLHPMVTVEQVGDGLRLVHGDVALRVYGDFADVVLLRGCEQPIAGWYSPAYGKKEPTTTIRVVKYGLPADVGFTTRIMLD